MLERVFPPPFPPSLPCLRRRSKWLLERLLPPPLLAGLLHGAEEPEVPSLDPLPPPCPPELEDPLERSPCVTVRACPASALASCWKLSSSRMRKERAL